MFSCASQSPSHRILSSGFCSLSSSHTRNSKLGWGLVFIFSHKGKIKVQKQRDLPRGLLAAVLLHTWPVCLSPEKRGAGGFLAAGPRDSPLRQPPKPPCTLLLPSVFLASGTRSFPGSSSTGYQPVCFSSSSSR